MMSFKVPPNHFQHTGNLCCAEDYPMGSKQYRAAKVATIALLILIRLSPASDTVTRPRIRYLCATQNPFRIRNGALVAFRPWSRWTGGGLGGKSKRIAANVGWLPEGCDDNIVEKTRQSVTDDEFDGLAMRLERSTNAKFC